MSRVGLGNQTEEGLWGLGEIKRSPRQRSWGRGAMKQGGWGGRGVTTPVLLQALMKDANKICKTVFKGTVSRDFRLLVLIMNQFPPSRCRWYRWQICRGCCWYRLCTLTCEYLREFLKKLETVLTGYSGAGGKLIHEKNQKQKISRHCPFNTCCML